MPTAVLIKIQRLSKMSLQCLSVSIEIKHLPVLMEIKRLPEMSLQPVLSILQIEKALYMPFTIQSGEEKTDYLFDYNNELDI